MRSSTHPAIHPTTVQDPDRIIGTLTAPRSAAAVALAAAITVGETWQVAKGVGRECPPASLEKIRDAAESEFWSHWTRAGKIVAEQEFGLHEPPAQAA